METWSADAESGNVNERASPRVSASVGETTPLRNLEDQLKALDAQTERLRRELDSVAASDKPVVSEITLADLETTVERLRVAEEDLRVQNDELVRSRHDVEGALTRYRELFEMAPDPYIVTDARGIIREANSAAARLLGAPHDRLLGSPLVAFVAGAERRAFRLALLKLSGGEKPTVDDGELMLTVKPRKADALEVACTVAGVHDPHGKLTNLRWLLRDITTRRRAELELRNLNAQLEQRVQERTAALEAANWAKAEFLAVMAHELRTPLNAILGYTELLEMGLPGPVTEGQIAHLARIRSGGMRLIALIDEVLDLGKVEAGQLRVVQEELSILAATNSALTLLLPQAAARGVRLENECARSPDVLYLGDQTRVEQILINLLSNSIKFTDAGGTVTINCEVRAGAGANARLAEASGPWVALRVADTGIGIAPQVLSRVFEPFVQVESPLTRTKGGTGLGLTISRRLARLMGGDLTVESKEGIGSQFTVWLPAAQSVGIGLLPESDRRGPERHAKGMAELGKLLLEELDAVIRKYGKHLCGRAGLAAAHGLTRSDLEDHAAALLADIVQSLVVVEEAEGEASAIMRDGSVLRRVISERHGAQRRRLGWTEKDLEREFDMLRAAVFAALRRVSRQDGEGGALERKAAQGLLDKLLRSAEEISLRGYRMAALDDSRA
jgi:PAS domain S-box-containing protein